MVYILSIDNNIKDLGHAPNPTERWAAAMRDPKKTRWKANQSLAMAIALKSQEKSQDDFLRFLLCVHGPSLSSDSDQQEFGTPVCLTLNHTHGISKNNVEGQWKPNNHPLPTLDKNGQQLDIHKYGILSRFSLNHCCLFGQLGFHRVEAEACNNWACEALHDAKGYMGGGRGRVCAWFVGRSRHYVVKAMWKPI